MTSALDFLPSCNQKTILAPSCEAHRGSVSGWQAWSRFSSELSFLFVRTTIPKSTWAEIRTAYAFGIGLREISRSFLRLDQRVTAFDSCRRTE